MRAAFSVPVTDGDKVLASLAVHFHHAHRPTPVDIERNEVFARLFAISLRSRQPMAVGEPQFAYA